MSDDFRSKVYESLHKQRLLFGPDEIEEEKHYRVEYKLTPILVQTEHKDQSIEARFARFHEANPHVYDAICACVALAWRHGVRKGSMRNIYEKLRWDHYIATKGEEQWVLNDHYVPMYARKVMDEHPEWEGFFELRKLRAKGKKKVEEP